MKKVLKTTLSIAFACFVFASSAQQRPERPSPEEMLQKVTKELSLSEEQVTSWQAIHEKYSEGMRSDPKTTMPKVDAEIKAILTEDQWEKFEQMKPKRGRKRKN